MNKVILIFRDVKNFEGLYKVSNDGRVFSVKRNKILKPKVTKDGYFEVCLFNSHNNSRCYKRVHRLVAETFIEHKQDCNVVNHLDSNKLNNNVENLEWTTISGNTKHCFINNERFKKQVLNNAFNGKETNKKSIKVFLNGIYINTYESITIASKALNINKKTIYNSIFKGMKNRKGYNFCLN